MRVNDVEAVALRRGLDRRFANAQKWISSREYCLVKLTADDGSVGWGECWGPIAGNREIVEEYVAPWLVGKDPREVERLHDELVFKLRSSYHSTVPAGVVSGVDTALWDLYGKAVGEPVSTLLGSRQRDHVPAYATGHFFPDVHTIEEFKRVVTAEAEENVAAGFDALKVKIGVGRHFPWGPETDVEILRSIREAVGDDVRLMADANHAYDLTDARHVGRQLENLDVYFFEEPIPPEHIEEYALLNDTLDVPIAGGECWAFLHEFDRVLDANAVGYVQPDVTSAGGITSMRRIVSLSDAANVTCFPHVFGSAIALASSLQVLATVPGETMLEFDRTPNPIRDELVVDPIVNEGTTVQVPEGPGLGIEVDTTVLEEFRVDG